MTVLWRNLKTLQMYEEERKMEKISKGKWQLIARYCSNQGYNKAGAIAIQIDTVLSELYGKGSTKKWINDYERGDFDINELSDMDISEIASTAEYCVACEKHLSTGGCSTCLFGKTVGFCIERNSLFNRFATEFGNVAGY